MGNWGADIADDFWRAKINLAFIQGEKLYHSRNSAQSPITIPFENQEILYHTSCPLPHYAHSTEQSIAFYPIEVRKETESWKLFREQAAKEFFAGSYAGKAEEEYIEAFEKNLA